MTAAREDHEFRSIDSLLQLLGTGDGQQVVELADGDQCWSPNAGDVIAEVMCEVRFDLSK